MPGEYVATLLDARAGVDATAMRACIEELRTELLKEAARAQGRIRSFR